MPHFKDIKIQLLWGEISYENLRILIKTNSELAKGNKNKAARENPRILEIKNAERNQFESSDLITSEQNDKQTRASNAKICTCDFTSIITSRICMGNDETCLCPLFVV